MRRQDLGVGTTRAYRITEPSELVDNCGVRSGGDEEGGEESRGDRCNCVRAGLRGGALGCLGAYRLDFAENNLAR